MYLDVKLAGTIFKRSHHAVISVVKKSKYINGLDDYYLL
jgi:hypothetical protein